MAATNIPEEDATNLLRQSWQADIQGKIAQ
jgi:hypothetical protein